MTHQSISNAAHGRMPRVAVLIITAILSALVPPLPVRAASSAIEVENIRIGFALPNDSEGVNSIKVGTWTPVRIQLRAGEARFAGFMDVLASDDDGTPTSFRLPIDVPAAQSQIYTAYIRSGSREPDLGISIYDGDKRRVLKATQGMLLKTSQQTVARRVALPHARKSSRPRNNNWRPPRLSP